MTLLLVGDWVKKKGKRYVRCTREEATAQIDREEDLFIFKKNCLILKRVCTYCKFQKSHPNHGPGGAHEFIKGK